MSLDKRSAVLQKQYNAKKKLDELKARENDISDQLVQIDVDLIQEAFDEHDSTVSVGKKELSPRVFR